MEGDELNCSERKIKKSIIVEGVGYLFIFFEKSATWKTTIILEVVS
jgi:hypothetical protein